MRAGQLRHRVTFQTLTVVEDDFGEPDATWAALDTVWARVESLAGKERFAAMQQQAEADYRIVCRYHSGLSSLTTDDRVAWGGKVFDIKSIINPDERNVLLEVYAKVHND